MDVGRAWPATPRPQHDEAFGSWLGRVAARYRIGVDELISAAAVEVDIGERASTWLAAVPKGEGAFLRLCSIAGLAQQDLLRMLPGERLRAEVFPCCYRCLILNPREVEAPYWPLRWMTAGGRSCDHPASEVENVTPGMLSKARNMARLLKQLERKHYRRIAGKSLSSRLLSVTSKVRGSD